MSGERLLLGPCRRRSWLGSWSVVWLAESLVGAFLSVDEVDITVASLCKVDETEVRVRVCLSSLAATHIFNTALDPALAVALLRTAICCTRMVA
jgi:hypothetical protein